jgi:RimJ/RimL family protein N-acetyltransferase
MTEIDVRPVVESDLHTFYEHQTDPEAIAMAVFGAREREIFMEHWHSRILANADNYARTITVDGEVAGNLLSWDMDGYRYVGYWIGREFWGRGVATEALTQLTGELTVRPLYALVVVTNIGSQRVLEKSGFKQVERHMSPKDGLEEFVYRLD